MAYCYVEHAIAVIVSIRQYLFRLPCQQKVYEAELVWVVVKCKIVH